MAGVPPVLIVTDDPLWRKQLTRALALTGYATVAADSLSAALAAVAARPSAILLDAASGAMRAVARARGTSVDAVPLLLLANEDDGETLAAELGADAFLRKPFGLADLLALLSQHVVQASSPRSDDAV